jgi:hypothetical protein
VKDANGYLSWKRDFKFLRALAKEHGLIWGGDSGRPNVKSKLYHPYHVPRCTIGSPKVALQQYVVSQRGLRSKGVGGSKWPKICTIPF